MTLSILPTVNAILNGTSASLLVAGYLFIKKENVKLHGILMSCAFLASTLFLASYLTYHFFHGRTPFPGTGWVRPLYFAILISHTVLAVVIVPLVLRTLYLALRARFKEHERIARWTLPLWLYVSVTGVVVYLMLYQVDWALGCPTCGEEIAKASPALTRGFRQSITLLMMMPYLLFAGVSGIIFERVRRRKKMTDAAH